MQALTPNEMLKVLKVASASKRNHAMILCAFRFGMRASPKSAICGCPISICKNGTITIRRLKGSRTSVCVLDERTRVNRCSLLLACLECVARRAQDVAGCKRLCIRLAEGRQT